MVKESIEQEICILIAINKKHQLQLGNTIENTDDRNYVHL